MPLDSRAQRLLHMLAASAGDAGPQTVEDRRRGLASLTEMAGGEAPEVASVEDGALPGPAGSVPFRLYRPMSPGAGIASTSPS